MARQETDITADIVELLEAVPESEVVKLKGGAAQESGLPDLLFTCAALGGRAVWIEVKKPGETPRKLQGYKLDRWRRAGCVAVSVTSVGHVEAMLGHLRVFPAIDPEPVAWTSPLTNPLRQKFARRA